MIQTGGNPTRVWPRWRWRLRSPPRFGERARVKRHTGPSCPPLSAPGRAGFVEPSGRADAKAWPGGIGSRCRAAVRPRRYGHPGKPPNALWHRTASASPKTPPCAHSSHRRVEDDRCDGEHDRVHKPATKSRRGSEQLSHPRTQAGEMGSLPIVGVGNVCPRERHPSWVGSKHEVRVRSICKGEYVPEIAYAHGLVVTRLSSSWTSHHSRPAPHKRGSQGSIDQ